MGRKGIVLSLIGLLFCASAFAAYKTDKYYVADTSTYVEKDGSNNLSFTDAVTGTKTLAQLGAAEIDPVHTSWYNSGDPTLDTLTFSDASITALTVSRTHTTAPGGSTAIPILLSDTFAWSNSGKTIRGMDFTVIDNCAVSGGVPQITGLYTSVQRASTATMTTSTVFDRGFQSAIASGLGTYNYQAGNSTHYFYGLNLTASSVTNANYVVDTNTRTHTINCYLFNASQGGTGPTITSGTVVGNYYGAYITLTGVSSLFTSTGYGYYVGGMTTMTTAWGYYNNAAGANNFLGKDNVKSLMGTGFDASIYYDATDLCINTQEVGTGNLNLVAQTVSAITTETLTNYVTIKIGGVAYKIAIVS